MIAYKHIKMKRTKKIVITSILVMFIFQFIWNTAGYALMPDYKRIMEGEIADAVKEQTQRVHSVDVDGKGFDVIQEFIISTLICKENGFSGSNQGYNKNVLGDMVSAYVCRAADENLGKNTTIKVNNGIKRISIEYCDDLKQLFFSTFSNGHLHIKINRKAISAMNNLGVGSKNVCFLIAIGLFYDQMISKVSHKRKNIAACRYQIYRVMLFA